MKKLSILSLSHLIDEKLHTVGEVLLPSLLPSFFPSSRLTPHYPLITLNSLLLISFLFITRMDQNDTCKIEIKSMEHQLSLYVMKRPGIWKWGKEVERGREGGRDWNPWEYTYSPYHQERGGREDNLKSIKPLLRGRQRWKRHQRRWSLKVWTLLFHLLFFSLSFPLHSFISSFSMFHSHHYTEEYPCCEVHVEGIVSPLTLSSSLTNSS